MIETLSLSSEQLTLEKEKAIAKLIDNAFECSGYGRDVFGKILANHGTIIAVSWEGDLPVAFGFAYMATPNSLTSILQDLPPDLPTEVSHADAVGNIGVLKTICTSPLHQGKGLATRVITALNDELNQKGAQEIVVPCWELNDKVNLERALACNGFSYFKRTRFYWRTDCDAGHFKCIGRSRDRCTCHAIFFRKTN